MKKELGLYVHIPFCVRKCAYCDFPSFAGREKDMEAYVDRLIGEMKEKADPGAAIATLYVGGGTPSLLPPYLMERVLAALRDTFDFLPDAECSCECNPGTVTEPFLRVLKKGGINRLSFGAQAFQARLLHLLGRIHTWEQVEESVSMARAQGFSNLNLDLMLGLPGQTLADMEETLESALALSPTHLSCYGLIVEEGTKMHDQVENGAWTLPDEETERDMYELCRSTLSRRGFLQYEISNFAKEGYACRHNLDCWHREEYLGIGVGAASLIGHERFRNPGTIFAYMAKQLPERITLSETDEQFESVMLGLRLIEGISDNDFYARHRVHLTDVYGSVISRLIGQGLLEWKDQSLRCTPRGLDIQNDVLTSFLPD